MKDLLKYSSVRIPMLFGYFLALYALFLPADESSIGIWFSRLAFVQQIVVQGLLLTVAFLFFKVSSIFDKKLRVSNPQY